MAAGADGRLVLSRPGPGVDGADWGRWSVASPPPRSWAVGLIVASGVFQAWRQIGSWRPLTDTDYGTILLLQSDAGAGRNRGRLVEPALGGRAAGGPNSPDSPTSPAAPAAFVSAAPTASTRPDGPGATVASGRLASGGPGGAGRARLTRAEPTAPLPAMAGLRGRDRARDRGAHGGVDDAAPPQGETVRRPLAPTPAGPSRVRRAVGCRVPAGRGAGPRGGAAHESGHHAGRCVSGHGPAIASEPPDRPDHRAIGPPVHRAPGWRTA